MARTMNPVGSLSALKRELGRRDITQFHSIKDINEFERTYLQQLEDAKARIRRELQSKLEAVSAELSELSQLLETKQASAEGEVDAHILKVNACIMALESMNKNPLQRLGQQIRTSLLNRKVRQIESGRASYVDRNTRYEMARKRHLQETLRDLSENFEDIAAKEIDQDTQRIRYIRESIDDLRPVILGSIGESMVSATLAALPDRYTVINDVHIRLAKPIYLPSEKDRIHSFQIDHVVVGPGGVFAVETKHWGHESIESRDLFSPVKQVRRSGYALYRVINNEVLGLKDSWGERSVSVHNVIVFTISSVREKYKHVKLLELCALNAYIQQFDESLTEANVDRIVSHLVDRCVR